MNKTDSGRFFEDYALGQIISHATPRTITEGDTALYQALYPTRFALQSSDEFARDCGYPRRPVDDLITFHVVFGKSVPDISINAVANLGYAEARFLNPVYPGDTLSSTSEVIGLKQNSNGKTGIIWVRTTGCNQSGNPVLQFCRWVMVRKSDQNSAALDPIVPELEDSVAPETLLVPERLDFTGFNKTLSGSPYFWDDYTIGEIIDHVNGNTIEEAEHMLATRLWQNTAKVHFDASSRPNGRRLIYGGHVISMARALSFNGLGNAMLIAAINAGSHANPCFAGDTVFAWSEVLDKAETLTPGVGALRLRLVATTAQDTAGQLRDEDGRYLPHVLLDLDIWTLIPL